MIKNNNSMINILQNNKTRNKSTNDISYKTNNTDNYTKQLSSLSKQVEQETLFSIVI